MQLMRNTVQKKLKYFGLLLAQATPILKLKAVVQYLRSVYEFWKYK